MTKRVIGLGGVFFKAENPIKLKEWYQKHLGITSEDWGAVFSCEELGNKAYQVWSINKTTTEYYDPSKKEFMINYQVADLHWLVGELIKEGVKPLGEIDENEFGKFAWILDPENNKIELWEAPKNF